MKRWYFGLGIAAAVAVLAGSIAVGAVITQAAPPFQQPTTGQNRVSLGVGLDDRTGKVIVREVRANSPAAAAGLSPGLSESAFSKSARAPARFRRKFNRLTPRATLIRSNGQSESACEGIRRARFRDARRAGATHQR